MKELERRLLEAGRHYPFPPTPPAARNAAARLSVGGTRRRVWPAAVAAALVVAIAAVLALSPGARSAVVDWLDAIPGVRIERGERLPRSRLLPGAEFGRRVSLGQARRLATFRLRLPPGLGAPSTVFLDRSGSQSVFTVQYGNRLMLTEWRTAAVLLDKLVLENSRVEPTIVDGNAGAWITGGEHAVFYLGFKDTREHSEQGRLAGNVLLWQRGAIGYRLETAAGKKTAMKLARSLKP